MKPRRCEEHREMFFNCHECSRSARREALAWIFVAFTLAIAGIIQAVVLK